MPDNEFKELTKQNRNTMISIFTTFAIACVAILLVLAAFSFIPVLLWYMIDDRMATYTGLPILGELSVTFVWPICFLISLLFKSVHSNSK